MTFSPNTLAVGPTQRIERYLGTRVRIIPVPPGEDYTIAVDGQPETVTTEPSASGELIIQLAAGSGSNSVMALHVAVEINGELFWKRASLIPAVNRYTRQQERFTA